MNPFSSLLSFAVCVFLLPEERERDRDETKVFTSIGMLERPIAIEPIDGSVQLERCKQVCAHFAFNCYAIDSFCVFALVASVANDRTLYHG